MRLVIYLNAAEPGPTPGGRKSRMEMCHEYAAHYGHTVVAEYEDDSAEPPEGRAGWQCVTDAIEAGKAEGVLTWALSMISTDPQLPLAFFRDVLAPRGGMLAEARDLPESAKPRDPEEGGW